MTFVRGFFLAAILLFGTIGAAAFFKHKDETNSPGFVNKLLQENTAPIEVDLSTLKTALPVVEDISIQEESVLQEITQKDSVQLAETVHTQTVIDPKKVYRTLII